MPVCKYTRQRRAYERGDHPHESDKTKKERRICHAVDQPAYRHLLHPGPNKRHPLPEKKETVVPVADAGKDIGLKPVAAPALPIAADKASRLQALLTKYQADQISPEEYHKQRAAILAEP